MSKSKQKYYTVWEGRETGVFDDWESCKKQIQNHEHAKYMSFPSKEAALEAYRSHYWDYVNREKKGSPGKPPASGNFIRESLAVDAACSGNPGKMEYRGVYIAGGQQIFHVGPMKDGTNNIGEFLAIVHALALLKKENSPLPIYSDSLNAMLWVKNKKCKTKLEKTPANAPIFDLIARAEKWLSENTYTTRIMKWETKAWGEIPADFGRKGR
ncbi:MAG: ribonuclease H family protein [Dysgonamonadaceae bacterium]|nr:ribonuclease H family protein [Dysgonamonadaceae bacterium]